eukprot:9746877-Ditylum_brightwellii.AAC.1
MPDTSIQYLNNVNYKTTGHVLSSLNKLMTTKKTRVLQSLPAQQLPVLSSMLDFSHTNDSELINATDKSSQIKKIPQDWLNQNKITKEHD